MAAKGSHGLPTALSSRSGKTVATGLVASLVATLAFVLGAPALAASPVYPVMNTAEYPPDGVYFRTRPDWAAADRTAGFGVYAGDRVQLRCHASGTNVPRRDGGTNTIWYQADNTSRPSVAGRANSGWINAHFVNDGTGPNQVAASVPSCAGAATPTPDPPPPGKVVYGAKCAQVTMLVIPGSNESNDKNSPDLRVGMLQNVTDQFPFPAYNADRLRLHYIPYPSQIGAFGVQYDPSRGKGYGTAWTTMKTYASQCPGTKFILLGYSQGAHIAGDLTATIANESTPISKDRLLATALLGDAARQPSFRPLVGMNYSGGHGIRGSRDFGSANNKVTEYCAAHDPVCDYAGNGSFGRAAVEAFRAGPHKTYQSAKVPGTNTTYTTRIADDLKRRF